MFNLKVERRDKGIKAKKLRRMGWVPATIYGTNLKESILIQISQPEIINLFKNASKGSLLSISVEKEKYNVLLKEISHGITTDQAEHIEFQHVVADSPVNSVAKVVLLNREGNQNLVQQFVEEIPYNALPKDFVEEVTIDLSGMEAGTSVKVGDLDIAKNDNVRLLIQEDTTIITVEDPKSIAIETDEDDEEEAEDVQPDTEQDA